MTGSVLRIARHDFLSVRRSRLLWGVIGAYALFTVFLLVSGVATPVTDATQLLVGTTGVTALVLPVVGIVAGYLAIAGEREDGTVTIRLGLPDTRLAVLAGKLLSRGATVVLALGAGFAVAVVVAVGLYGGVDVGVFVRFAAISTLFAVTNAAVAVGLSAAAASRARAMTLAGGFYVCADVLWLVGSNTVVGAVRAIPGAGDVPAAAIRALGPVGAYLEAMELAFTPGTAGPVAWLGVVVMAAWGLAVPALGYYRFRGADLA